MNTKYNYFAGQEEPDTSVQNPLDEYEFPLHFIRKSSIFRHTKQQNGPYHITGEQRIYF